MQSKIEVIEKESSLDKGAFFEGLLEILYALRCLLFHGEIEPTNRYRNIYELAYFILRRFLSCIE